MSLIPFTRSEASGGQRIEKWNTYHSFLAKRAGDVEDHCALLCSLLLGFGLDAYVAIGKVGKDTHCWVLTCTEERVVEFWETSTGQRMRFDDDRASKFYTSISCVFTINKFYANIQAEDRVSHVFYDFDNTRHWKALDVEKIKEIGAWNYTFPLRVMSEPSAENIEKKVKDKIAQHRMNVLLVKTIFDEALECILSPALANYELERLSGLTFGNEDFKSAITRIIPHGHTFKAFPIQTQSIDEDKIFLRVLHNEVGKDILETVGDCVRFAVRVKVVNYPESILTVWTIIAVRYSEVS